MAATATAAAAYTNESKLDGLTEAELVYEAEVDAIVREALAATIGEAAFNHGKVDAWVDAVLEGVQKQLAGLAKPFKYVTSCVITQRAGAGLHTACSATWNPRTDGKCSVLWENRGGVLAVVAVFWAAR